MGTTRVTAFCFIFKTSNEDTECFHFWVCSIANPVFQQWVKIPLELHIFRQLQNAWLHETLIWCYTWKPALTLTCEHEGCSMKHKQEQKLKLQT